MIVTASQHFITDNISHNIITCYHTPHYTHLTHSLLIILSDHFLVF